jgi:2-polyprenyl-6-methoxyphenol hydroxylase-like FAD-dependent oxidoreductase
LEVCIVGGGLAELACAISLATFSDIKISLLELRYLNSKGATFGLALNGQKAMAEICPSLLEELSSRRLVF